MKQLLLIALTFLLLATTGCVSSAVAPRAGAVVDEVIADYEEDKAAALRLFRDRAYFLMHRYRSTLEAQRALAESPDATPEQWRRLMGEIERLETFPID